MSNETTIQIRDEERDEDASQPLENFDNANNLILFDKTGDLMRIVQSNFSYDSKNLKYIFRYESIEYKLIDRFVIVIVTINENTSIYIYITVVYASFA